MRNQNLSPVSGAHDPRAAVDGAAIEIVVAALDRAHVHAAAYLERKVVGRPRIHDRAL